ncbi:MAG: amidohydrolase [Gammaproteobacteria bacterium CG22_combo_CG10-13_8_21_14_all_40_8]|nr:MAG: amidohydrolase [Gammaproteobacteria bacterium CG22_combo_CG10-13_8_21_14_all_40_8]
MLAQMQIYWEDAKTNCMKIEQQLRQQSKAVDIVVLPEMFNSGFQVQGDKVAETMNGYTVNWMKENAQRMNSVICGSLAIKEQQQCYNRLVWIEPSGAVSYYDKRHLFAMAGENERYSAGKERVVVNYKGWKILLQVCYDLRFPVFTAQQPEEWYDLILFVANWPKERQFAWNTLLPARAIENQSYVIGLNRIGKDGRGLEYGGNSQILDGMGEKIVDLRDLESFEPGSLDLYSLQQMRKNLPFLRDTDRFECKL